MTTQEALALLKLSPQAQAEDVEDALEQAVFDVKHELLRMEVVPRVFLARITKLRRLHEAEYMIFEEEINHQFPDKSMEFPKLADSLLAFGISEESSIEQLVKSYESKLVLAKQEMAQSLDCLSLARAIRRVASCQYNYESVVGELALNSIESGDLDMTKQSDQLGSVALLKLAGATNIKENPLGSIHKNSWQDLTEKQVLRLRKEKARVIQSKALAK